MRKFLCVVSAVVLIRTVIGILATTERAYWVKPFPDDPDELAQNATLRKELAQKIVPLGRTVQQMLADLPFGEGERFMKLLDDYNDLNRQFIHLVAEDKANSKPDIDYVYDRLHPHLLDTDFCEEFMMLNFTWTSEDVKRFYEKREIANDHYIDINLYHHWYH